MKDGTLNQASKILSVFGGAPRDQIQAILAKGLLADLRDANVGEIDRDTFRRVCGLKPLNPPLLERVDTITVAATTKRFVARDKFVLNYGRAAKPGVRIAYIGDNFKEWFFEKTEEPILEATLDYATLTRSALDREIRDEIGAEREETTLAEIYALMERQANGKEGVLLTNGWANIFYVCDASGTLRAMFVDWDSARAGWFVSASDVTYPGGWSGGSRVFSRNSSVPVAV